MEDLVISQLSANHLLRVFSLPLASHPGLDPELTFSIVVILPCVHAWDEEPKNNTIQFTHSARSSNPKPPLKPLKYIGRLFEYPYVNMVYTKCLALIGLSSLLMLSQLLDEVLGILLAELHGSLDAFPHQAWGQQGLNLGG